MNAAPSDLPDCPAGAAAALRSVWRGSELGRPPATVVPTGWPRLDAALPGGGWPGKSLTEVLTAQPAILEWRLLGPALRRITDGGGHIVAVSPPRQPYMPGLQQAGLDERRFIWIDAPSPADSLWTTEQLIKARTCGAIVAWLPQARHEQIRRLQVWAQSCDGPVFLCRPAAARQDASAAPLRVQACAGLDWELRLHVLKRRGPTLDQPLILPSLPGNLARIMTPRLRHPSRLFSREAPANALGSAVLVPPPGRNAAVQ